MSDDASNLPDEEKKYKRKLKSDRKKKRINNRGVKPLGRKIVVIKNKDKDDGNWHEHWKKNTKNIGRIPHPIRLVAAGSCGRGKTNVLKNLFLAHQTSNKKFQELYIVCCDTGSREWLDCEPNAVFDDIPDLDTFDRTKKTLLVLDDYEMFKTTTAAQRKLATLFRYKSSHCNLSIFCSYQNFFEVPSIARKCANCFLLYKPTADMEITQFANRVGLNKEDLHYIYKNICNDTYDSLFVDLTINSPCKLRKNVFTPIEFGDSSDEEE